MRELLNFTPTAISCEYAIGHKFHTIKYKNKTAFVSQYPDENCANFWIDNDRVKRPLFEGTMQEIANEINVFMSEDKTVSK